MLGRLESMYALLRLVSIDISLAGLAGGVMAARVLHAAPRPGFFIVLPLSVWVVYTLDHLLDAGRMRAQSSTRRHRFHFTHRRTLWILCAIAAVISGLLAIFELSWTGVFFGIIVAGLFCLHELIVKLAGATASPLLMKELGVAVIFTLGAWGLPMLWRLRLIGLPTIPMIEMMLQYLLLALVNLLVFAIFDETADTISGQTSFVRGVGRRNATGVIGVALMLAGSLGAAVLAGRPTAINGIAELIFTIMAAGLIATRMWPAWFVKAERFRTLGDGVFIVPLMILLVR